MDYVAVGCLGIDNIINTVGIKKLNVFGGNAAFGTAGISILSLIHISEPTRP